jgi:branched-chain amino acid transport system ATP-binding protein
MKILEVQDVRKTFGGVRAIDGVSLTIDEAGIVGLIGPNGSGKSTLFNLISGVYRPDAGQINFRGERIDGLPPDRIFMKGLVKSFQIPALFSNMTVLENVLVPPKNQVGERLVYAPIHSKWADQEVKFARDARALLEFIQLERVMSNLSQNLSGGQMKLCEIARAMTGTPRLMLLDEPTAGVAPNLAEEILEYIAKLRDVQKITFFIIEHRLEVFLKFVDHVYVMHLGRIISQGKPEEVVKDPLVQEAYLGADLLR